jgi:integrase
MKSFQMFGPTLFDIPEDVSSVPNVQTFKTPQRGNTSDVGSQDRPSSSVPAIARDRLGPAIEEPKRRKTYQFGTLELVPRKRSPDVWTFRYSKRGDEKKMRPRVIVGTILEYPTPAEARRACEHLQMEANEDNPLANATMRGLVYRFTEEVLRPCLDVPLGGDVDEDADLQYSTARNYRSHLKRRILPKWEEYLVKDFEKPEVRYSIRKWLRSLKRSVANPEGLAPKSVGQVYAAMRVLFNFAVHWGYLKSNPFSDKIVRPPRGCTKRLKPPVKLSPAQFLLLISNLNLREELAVKFDGWMSSRVNEPFGVKWEDLDLQSGVVTFRRGYVDGRFSLLKTEASRGQFALPKDVVELLRGWHEITPYNRPSDYVFASQYSGGRPFSPRTLMNNIQRAARRLGLPHIGWHTFRHSFARWTKDTPGMKLDDVKTLLRQETTEMAAQVYGGPELESTRKRRERVIRYVKKEGNKNKLEDDGVYLQLKTG